MTKGAGETRPFFFPEDSDLAPSRLVADER